MIVPPEKRPATTAQLIFWMLRYAGRRPFWLGVSLLSLLVRIVCETLQPWPTIFLIDYVLQGKTTARIFPVLVDLIPGPHRPVDLIGWSVAASIVVFLVGWAAGLAYNFASLSLGQRMVYDLAGELFARLQQLSLRFHRETTVGDTIRRVMTDCACVSVIVKDAFLPVISALISLTLMFGILWRIDPALTWLAMTVAPCMAVIFQRYAGWMLTMGYRQQEVEGRVFSLTEQTLSSIAAVQAFNREEINDRNFREATGQTISATLALTRVQLQFKILIGLVVAAGTAGVVWLGTRHALSGELTIGAILAFLAYLASLYTPLQSILYQSVVAQSAAGSAQRVWEILRETEEVKDSPGAKALSKAQGHVQIQNVTFGYESGRPILHQASLEVHPGELVAIVGETGAGKSTLVSLVPRFFDPWEGRVLLDGEDLREIKVQSLRRQVAVVLQDPFLFPISIAENIAYGVPQATQSRIEAAAREANAHEFIMRLPHRYRTVVGGRGATLSGGERQRISIARALLKNAPVLILDEPTSALDSQSETAVIEAIERLTRKRATLLIAHRLSTVRRADRVVVMRSGRVVESGRHEELRARGGAYAALFGRGSEKPALED